MRQARTGRLEHLLFPTTGLLSRNNFRIARNPVERKEEREKESLLPF
jgi:hypothetical protein